MTTTSQLPPTNARDATRAHWTATPCGSIDGDPGSAEYFASVDRDRYERYAPWMVAPESPLEFTQHAGERVLEPYLGWYLVARATA